MSDYDELRAYQQMLMCVDTPAYMQRAQAAEAAWNALLSRCRRQRADWLEMPTMRLGKLHALLESDWTRFGVLTSSDAHTLATQFETWQPKLQTTVRHTTSRQEIVRAVDALILSLRRFNERWTAFVEELDIEEVNRVRQGYNDYYVLEKECVVISPKVAQWGFEPLPPITHADIQELFPLAPVPSCR